MIISTAPSIESQCVSGVDLQPPHSPRANVQSSDPLWAELSGKSSGFTAISAELKPLEPNKLQTT